MNFMPFGQLKSFLKILIEVQYKFNKVFPRSQWLRGNTLHLLLRKNRSGYPERF